MHVECLESDVLSLYVAVHRWKPRIMNGGIAARNNVRCGLLVRSELG